MTKTNAACAKKKNRRNGMNKRAFLFFFFKLQSVSLLVVSDHPGGRRLEVPSSRRQGQRIKPWRMAADPQCVGAPDSWAIHMQRAS